MWVTVSLLTQVTVLPTLTVSGVGENRLLAMVTDSLVTAAPGAAGGAGAAGAAGGPAGGVVVGGAGGTVVGGAGGGVVVPAASTMIVPRMLPWKSQP